MAKERDILQLRSIVASGGVDRLTDEELIRAGSTAREPHVPSRCLDWAEREAVPMLHELAKRLKESPQLRTREHLKQWLETEFRAACLDDARVMEAAALLKVGHDAGYPVAEVLRRTIAGFVRELIDPAGVQADLKR